VEKDAREAVRLYRLAADQGHASAQSNLGVCYHNGQGVEKDAKEAVRLYRLAANQGLAGAQVNLGACYYIGEGVEKDAKEAARLFGLAANQGHAAAKEALRDLRIDLISDPPESKQPSPPQANSPCIEPETSGARDNLKTALLKAENARRLSESENARLKTELENARLKAENAALKLERLEASCSKPLLDEDGREIGRVPVRAAPSSNGRKRPRSPNENVLRQLHASGASLKKVKVEKAATAQKLEAAEDELEDAQDLNKLLVLSENNKMTEIDALKTEVAQLKRALAAARRP
jgi:TPR repeat protein